MNDRFEAIAMVAVGVACCAFCGSVFFAVASAFVAFGFWMLRLAGLVT